MDYFVIEVSEQEIKREKEKARELRRTMDHLVPIIRGGKSVRGNVAPACKECNFKKKYMLPIEWEEYLKSGKR
ncbi:MAG: hypothetical protein FD174_4066 [Geobacteraceae bacterium]|nr:MAG: hypothetical protein FD174_4066 [Geobacteraceae bacterium]